ncbi:MAG: universal stress protein [Rhodobacteraceae bacterium]|nr:universal stress protein [Paracoccaceae bacterium]MBR9821231.1 universal stress protein [Paracoccaceae bacterium]
MSQELFVVAYEGDDDSGSLLDYAIARAVKEGAALHIVHVLEWSPYSFLTPQEVEERHARRKEELARAKSAIIDPAVEKVAAAGATATGEIRYGQVVELIVEIATTRAAAMIFVGRSGSNSVAARVFGSVPLGLAQLAPVPTVIVP